METFVTIIQVLADLAVVALCTALVIFIIRLKAFLEDIGKDIKEISARTLPVLDNVEVFTDKIRSAAENIDDQIELVKGSIGAIREMAENIVDLERRVQARIEEPMMETVGTIAAVLKGVRTFFVRLRA